ncbi:MAG: hypothetical protein Q4G25_16750 [Paracoccus sp. (in: a-proteobacteria)]|nr:hypothetical protein [Paracoccus sp. (in: a-proteobacteria)]
MTTLTDIPRLPVATMPRPTLAQLRDGIPALIRHDPDLVGDAWQTMRDPHVAAATSADNRLTCWLIMLAARQAARASQPDSAA